MWQNAQQQIAALKKQQTNALLSDGIPGQDHSLHNTYDLEQTLMDMIRRGDTSSLSQWIAHAPAIRGGVLAPDQLRQRKNTFIVTATLASRAAIRGGLSVDDAFSLSDSYIQKCELISHPDQITGLQYYMVQDFAGRVEQLHHGRQDSQLVLQVSDYIHHHMSEPVSVEKMAKQLFMSRSYLSRRFKKETGESLTAISLYLGFSSQSHFARVFRKYAKVTPGEYRQRHSVC